MPPQIQASDAARLLGTDLVDALHRRGLPLAAIDWQAHVEYRDRELDSGAWFEVVPVSDATNFATVRLPLFVHLFLCIERRSEASEGNATTMSESVASVLDWLVPDDDPTALSQLGLLTLMVSRTSQICVEHRPPEDVEILLVCQEALHHCVIKSDILTNVLMS